MSESFKTRLMRWAYNLIPCYRGGGGRIEYISDDLREIRVRVKLNWRTRNYVGTIYGGSMYSAIDPIYMVLLIKQLGPKYLVMDKSAVIRYRRPGRGILRATCRVTPDEVAAIRARVAEEGQVDRVYEIEMTDGEGTVCAEFEKTIHIRRRDRAG